MKKIFSIIVIIFISVSCGGHVEYNLPDGSKTVAYDEDSIRMLEDKKNRVEEDKYYYTTAFGHKKKLELKYYDTFKQAYTNLCISKKKKYNVFKEIKIFNHPRDVNEYISITKKNGNMYLTRDVVVYKGSKISCSIINKSLKLEKKEPIEKYVKKEYLVMGRVDSIMLPNLSENNRVYGVTTDSKVSSLRVENKKPDGIEMFEIDKTIYYFWYYNNLISKNEVDKYDIKYDK